MTCEDAPELPPPPAPRGAGLRGPCPGRVAFAVLWTLLAVLLAAAPGAGSASEEGPPAEPAPSQPASEAALPAPTLEAFMRGMAETSGVEARFREVKELGLLSTPLRVEGRLAFVPPDRLVRTTTAPSRTRLVIDGDRFGFRDEAGEETIDLSSNPMAREFVESFIVLFNGDLEALRARYEPTFEVQGRRWRLVLEPRARALARVVERVTLSGEGRKLRRMELLETDGDRTTTHLEAVRVDRRFDAAERERLFAMPGEEPGGPAGSGSTGEAPDAP